VNAHEPFSFDRPTMFADMPAEQYHATDAVSYSGAKKLLRSPAHYVIARTKKSEPTPAMLFGSAAHAVTLEPDRAEQLIAVAPAVNKRTNAGREELAAFEAANAGRIILSPEDRDRVLRVRDAVHAHAGARALLQDGRPEVSLFWTDGEFQVPCKARLDYLRNADGGIVDLKTTQDASAEAFGRTIASFLYHMQAAHYTSGAEHVLGATPAFFANIAVETDEPFAVACYVFEPAHLLAGGRLMDKALDRYRTCIASGQWPAYEQTIQPAQMPAWALRFPE
jgi:exodeoxyribonuclease VIII